MVISHDLLASIHDQTGEVRVFRDLSWTVQSRGSSSLDVGFDSPPDLHAVTVATCERPVITGGGSLMKKINTDQETFERVYKSSRASGPVIWASYVLTDGRERGERASVTLDPNVTLEDVAAVGRALAADFELPHAVLACLSDDREHAMDAAEITDDMIASVAWSIWVDMFNRVPGYGVLC